MFRYILSHSPISELDFYFVFLIILKTSEQEGRGEGADVPDGCFAHPMTHTGLLHVDAIKTKCHCGSLRHDEEESSAP